MKIEDLQNDEIITAPGSFYERTIELPCIFNKQYKGIATIEINYIDITAKDDYDPIYGSRKYIQESVFIEIELQECIDVSNGIYEVSIEGFDVFRGHCLIYKNKVHVTGEPKTIK